MKMMMQYLLHFPKKEIIFNLISHDPVYEIFTAMMNNDDPQIQMNDSPNKNK